jgi:hypothetical protein
LNFAQNDPPTHLTLTSLPQRIMPDMGLEFNNREVLGFQEKKIIYEGVCVEYHHQAKDAAERSIQTLFNIL